MDDELISVAALHALVYCERLFYLEEVERIRVADAAVFSGRALHARVDKAELDDGDDGEEGSWERPLMECWELGLRGTADLLRRRDGGLVVYELKRGRSAGSPSERQAWDTDRVQVGAYAMLAETNLGQAKVEGRVRYAADRVTIRVPIDDALRQQVRLSVKRARALRSSVERPAITSQERKCRRCSLAPMCLPEESRLAADPKFRTLRLLPAHESGDTIHVTENGARVGRDGHRLRVELRDGSTETLPIQQVGSLVLHGMSQVSTQALRLCASRDISVHWMTQGGGLVGSLAPSAVSAQRHVRQFSALVDEERCLSLARLLVRSRISSQLRFVLRMSRGGARELVEPEIKVIRQQLRVEASAASADNLRGYEGAAAAAYFAALSKLCKAEVPDELRPGKRTRRPAKDRFSVLLNYGYGMLYREVVRALLAVGLHPGFGFYHRLRSSAQTLALDLMELFRVPLVDMPVMAAVHRGQFRVDTDFLTLGSLISLSDAGRAKMIELFERRKKDTWRHDVVGYSLSYARIIELEARLLEKEWSGEPGLFARLRIR